MYISDQPTKSPSPPPPVLGRGGLPRHFHCSRRAEGGGVIRILLAGELDLAATPYLGTALDGAQDDSDRVMLDLRALTLIDCAGLALLYGAGERARREGSTLTLKNSRGQVSRLLDLLGVPDDVTVVDEDDVFRRASRVAA
jgi:anti-sigma B factor antagonist